MKRMAKRILCVVLAAWVLVWLFAGCSGKTADKAKKEALEICEQYLDLKITPKEAKEKLNKLYNGCTFQDL